MDVLSLPSSLVPFNLSIISVGCLSLSCLDFTFPQPTHPHSHVYPFISFHHTQSFPFSLVHFSSMIRSAHHTLSLPSHHKQGLECLSKLIVSDGMFLSFKNHTVAAERADHVCISQSWVKLANKPQAVRRNSDLAVKLCRNHIFQSRSAFVVICNLITQHSLITLPSSTISGFLYLFSLYSTS